MLWSLAMQQAKPQSGAGYLIRGAFGWRYYGALFVVVLGALLMYFTSIANGPDRELSFAREVRSTQSPAQIDERIASMASWPNWFHMLASARMLDSGNAALREGSTILLSMDPKKAMSRPFELTARVERYVPGRVLDLKILSESTGKLFRLFDHIEWRIDVLPEGQGSLVRGTETAHTSNWRSRLFGTIAERILMYQIFYPDLVKLADPNWVSPSKRGIWGE